MGSPGSTFRPDSAWGQQQGEGLAFEPRDMKDSGNSPVVLRCPCEWQDNPVPGQGSRNRWQWNLGSESPHEQNAYTREIVRVSPLRSLLHLGLLTPVLILSECGKHLSTEGCQGPNRSTCSLTPAVARIGTGAGLRHCLENLLVTMAAFPEIPPQA